MEIKLKGNELIVRHKMKKNQTYKISKTNKFESFVIYKKPQIVKGVTSLCENSLHILMVDFDEVPRSLVESDFKAIAAEYKLPSAYLVTTGEREEDGEFFGNYHLICCKTFTANEVREIIGRTNADSSFMTMPLRKRWRSWVLRVGTKKGKDIPKLVKILPGKGSGEISTGHKKLFEALHGKIDYVGMKENNLNKIRLQDYEAT